jgi:hypothetical protein
MFLTIFNSISAKGLLRIIFFVFEKLAWFNLFMFLVSLFIKQWVFTIAYNHGILQFFGAGISGIKIIGAQGILVLTFYSLLKKNE